MDLNAPDYDPLEQISSVIKRLELGLGDGQKIAEPRRGEPPILHNEQPPIARQVQPRVMQSPTQYSNEMAHFGSNVRPFEIEAPNFRRLVVPQQPISRPQQFISQPSRADIPKQPSAFVMMQPHPPNQQNIVGPASVTDTSHSNISMGSISMGGERPSSTSRIVIKPASRSMENELLEKITCLEARLIELEQQQGKPLKLREQDNQKLAFVQEQLQAQQAMIVEIKDQNNRLLRQLSVAAQMQKLYEEQLKAYKIKALSLEKALNASKPRGYTREGDSYLNIFEKKRLSLLEGIGRPISPKPSEGDSRFDSRRSPRNLLNKK